MRCLFRIRRLLWSRGQRAASGGQLCPHGQRHGSIPRPSVEGLSAINAEVTHQAAILAYLQDFRLMMFVTLSALPLVLLLEKPAKSGAIQEDLHADSRLNLVARGWPALQLTSLGVATTTNEVRTAQSVPSKRGSAGRIGCRWWTS